MRTGFPLFTTKKVHFKSVASELEFFISGINDKQFLRDRKNRIWAEWQSHHNEDSIGLSYSLPWRRFGDAYFKNSEKLPPLYDDPKDQLANVIKTLKENPNDRRMVVSAWNPNQLKDCALACCHYTYCFQHINGKLSLNYTIRSNDLLLGKPFNVASYALLLELVCKQTGLQPYMLTANIVDPHLYVNHIDQAKIQIERSPRPASYNSIQTETT